MKKGGKKKGLKVEALPSAHAIRVDPVIADDLKAKASKAVAAKERKDKGEDKKKPKKEVDDVDEFDLMAADTGLNVSLSKKLGTPVKEKKKRAPKTSPSEKKGGKKKNPWSDSDASDVDGSDLSDAMDSVEVAPRERGGGRRAAANKAKFKFDDSDDTDKSDSDEELHDNTGVKEKDIHSGKVSDASDDDDDDSHFIDPSPPPKKKAAPAKKPYVAPVLDSDSEDEKPNGNGNGHATNGFNKKNPWSDSDEDSPPKKKPAAKKPAKKLTNSDDLFDNMMSNGDKPAKPAPKKKAAAKKPAAKKPAAKKPKYDSDSDDFNMDDVAPARDRPGRGKKPVNYGGSGSDSDSDFV